jgi:hypothetical protein
MSERKPRNIKKALLLVGATILFLSTYIICVQTFPEITLTVFTVALAGFSIAYVVYNRGFSRKNVKMEDLPMSWSTAEKHEFIEDGRRRLERSSWMLLVIIPLVIVYAYEAINLFLLPQIASAIGMEI